MSKNIVGRLREDAAEMEACGGGNEAATMREAADLLESLSPPDGVRLTLETTAEDRAARRAFFKKEMKSGYDVHHCDVGALKDVDTLVAALAAEKARGDGLAEERDAARVWHAERDRRIAALEAGLETADSWLMLHARHVGSCIGKSLCTCGLTLVRAETGALLSGQQDTATETQE